MADKPKEKVLSKTLTTNKPPKNLKPFIDKMAKENNGRFIITDKRTKKTYYGTVDESGKYIINYYDVLTGKNDNAKAGKNRNLDLIMSQLDKQESTGNYNNLVTPLGSFKPKKKTIYDSPGLDYTTHNKNTTISVHTLYPGEFKKRKNAIEDNNINNNNMSYGCINGRCGDVNKMVEFFKDGDTAYIIDTRLSEEENFKVLKENNYAHPTPQNPTPLPILQSKTKPADTFKKIPDPRVAAQQKLIGTTPNGIWDPKSEQAQKEFNAKLASTQKPIDIGKPYEANFRKPKQYEDVSLNNKPANIPYNAEQAGNIPYDLFGSSFPNTSKDMVREDGTAKGNGFLGILQNANGNQSSELSISTLDVEDGKEVLIPTLVPTLTQDEVNHLLSNKYDPTARQGMDDVISKKAIDFARERKTQELPYFATKEEEGQFKVQEPTTPQTLPNILPQPDGTRDMQGKNSITQGDSKVDPFNYYSPSQYKQGDSINPYQQPGPLGTYNLGIQQKQDITQVPETIVQPPKLMYNPDGSMALSNNWNLPKSQQVPFKTPDINKIETAPNQGNTDFTKDPSDIDNYVGAPKPQTVTKQFTNTYRPYEGLVNLFDFGLNTLASAQQKNQQQQSFKPEQPDTVYYNKRMLRGDNQMFAKNGGEYREGGEFEVDNNELENLRAQGYEFDIMEDGGEPQDVKPTIITNYKRDPRLQRYTDSLNAYNYTKDLRYNTNVEPVQPYKFVEKPKLPTLFVNDRKDQRLIDYTDSSNAYKFSQRLHNELNGYESVESDKPVADEWAISMDTDYIKKIKKISTKNKPLGFTHYQTGESLYDLSNYNSDLSRSEVVIPKGYSKYDAYVANFEKPSQKVVYDKSYVPPAPAPIPETPIVPKKPIGTINIEGKTVPYHSEEELKIYTPYKPTQVGTSKDYTISRFESPLYWEGDKVMDKKTGKPLFRDGGEGEPRKKDFVVPPFNSVVTDLNRQPIDNTSNKQVATSTGIPKKVLEKKAQTQIDAKAYSNAYEENARKERFIDAEKASNTPYTSDNWQEVLARTSQATGDKFRFSDKSNFFDDYINPFPMIGNMAAGVGSIPQDLQQGEYTKAALALGIPLSAGALGGIGAKSTGQFTNNIVNPLAGFSPGEFASNFSNKMDAAFIHKPVETFNGIINGAKGVIRDKRPFFETFPITKAQKEHIRNLQNVAFEEGNKFAEDWFIKDREGLFKDIYKNQKVIRPEVEKRILDLYGTENLPKNFLDNASSMFDVDELLITKNAKGINSINNKSNIDYLNQKRSSVGGINADDQSITFRNSGWYYETPQRIKDIAIHEASHSAQKIGSRFGVRPWGEETTKYSPKMNYYTSNPNTEIGREFGEAMTEPGKKYKKVWHSSPNELHSELMVARGRAYDNLVKKQGYTNEEAITKLQDLTDSNIDWLNKEYNLDRFFKPTTSIETKRKLIRALPAITGGIAVGASQQDKKYGGEKRRLKKPSYAEGGEYEVSDKEIQRLKKLGYEFETI